MMNYEEKDLSGIQEINDEQLDTIVGGAAIGDVVKVKSWQVTYCAKCGKLLMEYEATIVGERGVVDGKKLYWVKRSCCGYRSSVVETAIVD